MKPKILSTAPTGFSKIKVLRLAEPSGEASARRIKRTLDSPAAEFLYPEWNTRGRQAAGPSKRLTVECALVDNKTIKLLKKKKNLFQQETSPEAADRYEACPLENLLRDF